MEHDTEHTAILIFANSPEEELRHKPLLHGALLFDALTKRTLKTVRATGIPYFHYSENEQTGVSFGERFVNAVTDIFEKGYTAVITLGNDSPQLKASDILEAQKLLMMERCVLGPSADGGCYLIGLQKSHFDLLRLRNMPWQRGDLAQAIFAGTRQLGLPFSRLRMLYDLDSEFDIKQISRRFRYIGRRIRSLILSLFTARKEGHPPVAIGCHTLSLTTIFNKGSPGRQP